MENRFLVINYAQQRNSIYLEVEVFDAKQNKLYAGEVRFLDEMLYGDLVHDKKSPLTEECRSETILYLKKYFDR